MNPNRKNANIGEKSNPPPWSGKVSLMGLRTGSEIVYKIAIYWLFC